MAGIIDPGYNFRVRIRETMHEDAQAKAVAAEELLSKGRMSLPFPAVTHL